MTIGVVVADDQAIVRAGFRMLIDSEPDLAVLGEAANGAGVGMGGGAGAGRSRPVNGSLSRRIEGPSLPAGPSSNG